MRNSHLMAAIVIASLFMASCGGIPSGKDVDWTGLPDGTEQYLTSAVAREDCGPIRNVFDYIDLYEETPPAGGYVQSAYEYFDCSSLSIDEYFDRLVGTWPSLGEVSEVPLERNPMYFGPGCIGLIGVVNALRQPPRPDLEQELVRQALATQAILESLPDGVTKTGTQDPTPAEDAAMELAAATLRLGDALLESEVDLDEALSWFQIAQQKTELACLAQIL